MQQSWFHLIQPSQLTLIISYLTRLLLVKLRKSGMMAAEKKDMGSIGIELQAISLLSFQEACPQHHEGSSPIL
jgi:hypothetical protein